VRLVEDVLYAVWYGSVKSGPFCDMTTDLGTLEQCSERGEFIEEEL
jgi:hypothetical protein